MSRSKSILLQVAFKEAVGATLGTDTPIATKTLEFYETLISLHDQLGITIEDAPAPRRNTGGSARVPSTRAATPASVIQFTASDGTVWLDWRPAKANGDANAKHPDFKTVDQTKGIGRSVWLFGQDGEPNAEAQELIAAADQMASLA